MKIIEKQIILQHYSFSIIYKMPLQSDHIWNAFPGADNFDNFKQNILESVYIKPEVSVEVKEDLLTIEKLLQHSYFCYEFIDIALTQVIFILEKSLRTRYKEIHGKAAKNMTLQKLLDWFFDNNYFESNHPFALSQLRNIRNTKVHDEKKILGGQLFIKPFYEVIDYINELHDDVKLRLNRKAVTISSQQQLNEILQDGGILTIDNIKYLIFSASINFIHNNQQLSPMHLNVWKVFDPDDYMGKLRTSIPEQSFLLTKWKYEDDKFTGIDELTKSSILIESINEKNREKFEIWKDKATQLEYWDLILSSINRVNNAFFIQEKRKFLRCPNI